MAEAGEGEFVADASLETLRLTTLGTLAQFLEEAEARELQFAITGANEFVREVLVRLDHDAPAEELLDGLYAAFSDEGVWKVFPETADTLIDLKARGVSLAVISNWDRRLPDILRSLDLYDRFETITVSSLEGVEKPSSEIFRRTVERMGVAAPETVHIGDSPLEDYTGAEQAGCRAALIDRHDLFADEAYRRISSLEEILEWVE